MLNFYLWIFPSLKCPLFTDASIVSIIHQNLKIIYSYSLWYTQSKVLTYSSWTSLPTNIIHHHVIFYIIFRYKLLFLAVWNVWGSLMILIWIISFMLVLLVEVLVEDDLAGDKSLLLVCFISIIIVSTQWPHSPFIAYFKEYLKLLSNVTFSRDSNTEIWILLWNVL